MAYLEDILKRLGWEDGFQIPVANEENQALEEELTKLAYRKMKAKNVLDNANARYDALKDHLKFVNQESDQTQKLITAHRQQMETEEHQLTVCKAEKSRIEQDIKTLTKRIEHFTQRQNVHKVDLEKGVCRLEKLKTETDWDIEALQAWEESLKKRDNDNELIKKFSKEDERKFNELEARRQLLQMEYVSKSHAIEKIVSELNSNEMMIERTGKAIKQQIHERENLINQWKDTVKMLQQRDEDINRAQKAIEESQEVLAKQEEKLDEENGFLNNEKRNNKQIELQLQELNGINTRMRKEYNELGQQILLMNSELHSLKRAVAAMSQTLEKQRIKGKKLSEEISNKEMLCIKYQEDLEKLEFKVQEMNTNKLTSADRVSKIQKIIENEEKQCAIYISDTEKINGNLFRADRLLKEQKDIGKNLEIDINNAHCICNKLRKHISDEKKNLEKVKEVVYDMEYRIDEFEQKLCKLEGSSKHDEHMDEKEEIIKQLEKTLAEHSEVQHTLQTQVDHLQDEMRRLSNFIAADREQLDILQNKVENHLLVYEIGRKQIAAAKQSTQEKQVEENMMRLRINHIENDMKKEEKRMFNLQKLRLTLDQIMKERQLEINTMKSIIQTKRRNLDEDRGRLRSDISVRNLKIDQLQKKYHITLMSLGKDEDGQPFSVTYFKIKNAQDRFMLQQEGDELDAKIKRAEHEIVAMENTLKVVNLTNATFKNNLTPVQEHDKEIEEMKLLECQLRDTTNKLRISKQELEQHKTKIEEIKLKKEELEQTKQEKQEIVKNLEDEYSLINTQEYNKQEQLQRAQCQLRKIKKKLGQIDIYKYMRDQEVRQIRDMNKDAMQRLTGLVLEYPELSPAVNRCSTENGVQLPQRASPAPSTSSFSTLDSCHRGSRGSTTSIDSRVSRISGIMNINVNKIDLVFGNDI